MLNVSRQVFCAPCPFSDANSTEFEPESKHPVVREVFGLYVTHTSHSDLVRLLSVFCCARPVSTSSVRLCPQVIEMPEHNPEQMGGTMRLGKRRTIFKSNNSVISEWS